MTTLTPNNRTEIMAAARASLQNKWKLAVGGALVYFLMTCGVSVIPGIGDFIYIAIIGPMTFGISCFFLKLSKNETPVIKDIFSGFSLFIKTVLTYLLLMIILLFFGVFLIVPGIIAAIFLSQTFFILVDNPTLSPINALKKSKAMMKGHSVDFFLLACRFIGWIVLSVLTAFIGFLWLAPYMYVSFAHFYQTIKNTDAASSQAPESPEAQVEEPPAVQEEPPEAKGEEPRAS